MLIIRKGRNDPIQPLKRSSVGLGAVGSPVTNIPPLPANTARFAHEVLYSNRKVLINGGVLIYKF
jgi:hypothetical protein